MTSSCFRDVSGVDLENLGRMTQFQKIHIWQQTINKDFNGENNGEVFSSLKIVLTKATPQLTQRFITTTLELLIKARRNSPSLPRSTQKGYVLV